MFTRTPCKDAAGKALAFGGIAKQGGVRIPLLENPPFSAPYSFTVMISDMSQLSRISTILSSSKAMQPPV